MRITIGLEQEWILHTPQEYFVAKTVKELSNEQACGLVNLFRLGQLPVFISRYRSDVHGGLSPKKIGNAFYAFEASEKLNSKAIATINEITNKIYGFEEKKAVAERLKKCTNQTEIAEISREYRTDAKKSDATLARDYGLEAPAEAILRGEKVKFADYLSKDLGSVIKVEVYLKHLLSEIIHRKGDLVKKQVSKIVDSDRKLYYKVTSKLTPNAIKKFEELRNAEKEGIITEDLITFETILNKYDTYINVNWHWFTVRDHQVSALERASSEKLINWNVEIEMEDARECHPFPQKNEKIHPEMLKFYQETLDYSIRTHFIPKLRRDLKSDLIQQSEDRAAVIFGRNVDQLFAQEGIKNRYVIALDPGTIIKSAFLDPSGQVISMKQFAIHDSTFEKSGIFILKEWASKTEGNDVLFAIGNGHNSFKTQMALDKMLQNHDFPSSIDVSFCIVPEHGASIWSCSEAARKEFGENAIVKLISAVSIGRRLIDPMSEYVKIEPQHLGKGQYQLSTDKKLLIKKLNQVVESQVSQIGINLNSASYELLKNIEGLDETLASEIIKYREKHRRFTSREELKRVCGLGDFEFQQCAGFLRVSRPEYNRGHRESGDVSIWNPFDDTIIHPEDYDVATRLLDKLGLTIEEISNAADSYHLNLTEKEFKIVELLRSKPELKPPPMMMKRARTAQSLEEGQQFTGFVRNCCDWGVFVDIGVEKDGLVHIDHYRRKPEDVRCGEKGSNINDKKKNNCRDLSIDHLEDVPKVGDVVNVTVKHYDKMKNRIVLVPCQPEKNDSKSVDARKPVVHYHCDHDF